jgi:hypothetical protein
MIKVIDAVDVTDPQGFSHPGIRIIKDSVFHVPNKIEQIVMEAYNKVIENFNLEPNVTIYEDDYSWIIAVGNLGYQFYTNMFYKHEYKMIPYNVRKETDKAINEWIVRMSLPPEERDRYLGKDEIDLILVQLQTNSKHDSK